MRSNTGVLRGITSFEDEKGRKVMRVIVDFYDGSEPEVNNGTVWHERPVTVTDASINQQDANNGRR